jgi:hypothetical protein
MKSPKRSVNSSIGSYQSSRVYKKAITSDILQNSVDYEGVAKNPVIVVHGFLGAHLKNSKTGRDVWGSFTGIDAIRGYSNKELQELSLPMQQKKTLGELKDNIVPTEFLSTFDINLFGVHFQRDAYDKLLDILTEAGYCREDRPLPNKKKSLSLFTFYYDWRRDLPENALKLHAFILEKRAYIQEKYKELFNVDKYDVHFDFLAHSMGGLLSRYYLRYGTQNLPADTSLPNLDWAGSKYMDKLFIIGTPNAGYLDTCTEMINGLQIANHAPFYPPAIIGTFHSYYQMMPLLENRQLVYTDDPNGKPVDIYDPQTWIDLNWGLADPKQDKYLKILLPNISLKSERRKIAIDHLTKCLKRAKQFTQAMRVYYNSSKHKPSNLSEYLFLGDAVKTRQTATVNRKTGKIKISTYGAGDGKVLASSARMDEPNAKKWKPFVISPIKWDAVIHLRAAHMGITAGDGFVHNLLYYLLAVPPKNYTSRGNK